MFQGGYSDKAKAYPLHPYQKQAINWVMRRLFVDEQQGAGLFLDPGLGKTRTTLSILDGLFEIGQIRKALIVAPLRPIYSVWPQEIDEWGFPQSYVILHNQYSTALACGAQLELVNYDGLVKLKDMADRWDMIVLDESTFIKNWTAKRTKYLRKIVQTTRHRMILTGTPAANSLQDLFSQVFMLDNGEALGRTVTAFRARYCMQGGWKGCKWLVRPDTRDSIKQAVRHLVLRMQAEDHLDMPELVQHELWVDLSKAAYKEYRRLKRELFAQLETGEVFAATAASAYGKCRQFANGQVYTPREDGTREYHVAHDEKYKALCELYEELSGKPLLIFYPFAHDLEEATKKGSPFRGCPVISGGMSPAAVQKILKGWNAGKYRAIFAQWQAASHGLNMQGCCNDIACLGVVDSLEIYDQAIRRVYRQGVTGSQVRVHRIMTRGTVDEVMLERLHGKHQSQVDFLNALKRHAKEL